MRSGEPGNSQEVRIAGVKVGQIVDSEPTDHNTSLVTLSMDPGHPFSSMRGRFCGR